MDLGPYDAWIFARFKAGLDATPEQVGAASGPWRGLAQHTAGLDPADRAAALDAGLAALSGDATSLEKARRAIVDAAPDGPPPSGPPGTEPWPALRLGAAQAAVPFPTDVLPAGLQGYCREVAESTRAAVDFVGVAMIATAGAAIGQSVNLRVKRRWEEPPILYAAVVAEPGKSKTPPLRLVVRPLASIDADLRERSRLDRERWEEARRAHAKDLNAPPPGPEPPQLRAIVRDVTRESLCIVLRDNPRGILCAPDELTAWAGSFDQYKSKGGTDKQFWLSLWSAEAVSVDRKGGRENTYVPHPFAVVMGGVQPGVLASLGADRGRDDGFLDRIVFSFPERFPSQTWTDQEVTREAEQEWEDVVRRLHDVPMRSDGDSLHPWAAGLTPAAKARFTAWYDQRGRELDDPDACDGRGGAMSKSRANLARLALILSRLRLACDPCQALLDERGGTVPPVDVEDVEGATRLVAYFEAHRARAVDRMTAGAGDVDAASLLEWIGRHKPASFREADVSNHLRRFRSDPDSLASAADVLIRAGAIRRKLECAVSGRRGPKPGPTYEVHPDLL